MKFERMLWFDEQVREGRHPGSAMLAARFGVSLRTARRDIEFLKDRLQAPLKGVPGTNGYVYEDPGFYLPSAFFRKDELFALLIARQLFGEIRPPLKEEVEGIFSRIADLFKAPLMEKIREAVSFEIARGTDVPGKTFFDLLRAVTQRRAVRLRCLDGDGVMLEREIEPLRLHFSRGKWRLAGIAAGRKGIGLYPLDRIQGVEVTGRRFLPGKGRTDVDASLRRIGKDFRGGVVRDAQIRFLPAKSSWASGLVLHPGQRLQFELDGSVVLEVPAVSFLEILGIVLQHAGDASVIGPRALREAVRAEAERLARVVHQPPE